MYRLPDTVIYYLKALYPRLEGYRAGTARIEDANPSLIPGPKLEERLRAVTKSILANARYLVKPLWK